MLNTRQIFKLELQPKNSLLFPTQAHQIFGFTIIAAGLLHAGEIQPLRVQIAPHTRKMEQLLTLLMDLEEFQDSRDKMSPR